MTAAAAAAELCFLVGESSPTRTPAAKPASSSASGALATSGGEGVDLVEEALEVSCLWTTLGSMGEGVRISGAG